MELFTMYLATYAKPSQIIRNASNKSETDTFDNLCCNIRNAK